MTQTEVFDIFNKQMIKIGTACRQDVHSQGLWHQTFHCWIINKSTKGGASLLFQLRHKDKDTFPNILDISCAGHLLSGETADDGVRELQEELGISIRFDELLYCGLVAQECIISSKIIDREFNHVYLFECDKSLDEYSYQKNEISGLFFINIEEFKQLLNEDRDCIRIEGIHFDESEGISLFVTREIYRNDITPQSSGYYDLLFNKIQRRIG